MRNRSIKKVIFNIIMLGLLSEFVFGIIKYQNTAFARTATVTLDTVNIRSGPGTAYSILGNVASGYRVEITGSERDLEGKTWYSFNFDGKKAYVREDLIRLNPDYVIDNEFENRLQQQNFPENYKPYLRELHQIFPNWIFYADHINISFKNAVDEEMVGTRTLVSESAISSHKSTDEGKYDWNTSKWPGFDGSYWNAASREITEYYMDPRNFLSENSIFQFESHTFNANHQTRNGLYELVKNTFLDTYIDCEGITTNYSNNLSITNNDMPIISPHIEASNTSNNGPIINQSPMGEMINNQNTPMSNGPMSNSNVANKDEVIIIDGLPTGFAPNTDLEVYSEIGPGAYINQNSNSSKTIIQPSAGNHWTQSFQMNVNTANVAEDGTVLFQFLPRGQYHVVDVLYNACMQANINPYAFVSMIFQEQGKDGKTDAVSGTNSKFPGFYNYININASHSNGLTATENGLLYAKTQGNHLRPWNTKERGIYGAVSHYASGYVSKGQDTFYLKKWNVQGENMFMHQFMTNVEGGAKEGYILSTSYNDNLKSQVHEFKIPVYSDLPNEVYPYPTKKGSPNNKLKLLGVTGYVLTPTFNMNTQEYSLIVPNNISNVLVQALAADNKSSIAGAGNVNLIATITKVNILVVAENRDQRVYTLNITRQGYVGQTLEANAGVGYINVDNSNNNQNSNGIPQAPYVSPPFESSNNIVAPTLSEQNVGTTVVEGPPIAEINNSNINSNNTQMKGPGE